MWYRNDLFWALWKQFFFPSICSFGLYFGKIRRSKKRATTVPTQSQLPCQFNLIDSLWYSGKHVLYDVVVPVVGNVSIFLDTKWFSPFSLKKKSVPDPFAMTYWNFLSHVNLHSNKTNKKWTVGKHSPCQPMECNIRYYYILLRIQCQSPHWDT